MEGEMQKMEITDVSFRYGGLAGLFPPDPEGLLVASWQPNVLHTMIGFFGHLRVVHPDQETHRSKSLQECYALNPKGCFQMLL